MMRYTSEVPQSDVQHMFSEIQTFQSNGDQNWMMVLDLTASAIKELPGLKDFKWKLKQKQALRFVKLCCKPFSKYADLIAFFVVVLCNTKGEPITNSKMKQKAVSYLDHNFEVYFNKQVSKLENIYLEADLSALSMQEFENAAPKRGSLFLPLQPSDVALPATVVNKKFPSYSGVVNQLHELE